MTISQTTTLNNKQKRRNISRGDLTYICSRNQHQAHNILLKALKSSGYTQKELSEITGIDEATISRLLRRPRNIELNTFSKLFYAATGAALNFLPDFPRQVRRA